MGVSKVEYVELLKMYGQIILGGEGLLDSVIPQTGSSHFCLGLGDSEGRYKHMSRGKMDQVKGHHQTKPSIAGIQWCPC